MEFQIFKHFNILDLRERISGNFLKVAEFFMNQTKRCNNDTTTKLQLTRQNLSSDKSKKKNLNSSN